MSIKQDAQNRQDIEELDKMVEDVATGSASDAVRMGYLARAQVLLRRLNKNGVNYEGTGDFIAIARTKAGVPNPPAARADGVDAGHTPSAPVAEGADQPSRKPGRKPKAAPSAGTGAEEPKA